jgi:hypothetical protein
MPGLLEDSVKVALGALVAFVFIWILLVVLVEKDVTETFGKWGTIIIGILSAALLFANQLALKQADTNNHAQARVGKTE